MLVGVKRWWKLQRTIRCAGHGQALPFGLPRIMDGQLHAEGGCDR